MDKLTPSKDLTVMFVCICLYLFLMDLIRVLVWKLFLVNKDITCVRCFRHKKIPPPGAKGVCSASISDARKLPEQIIIGPILEKITSHRSLIMKIFADN